MERDQKKQENMQLMNFEPFIDFEGITPQMASDLHRALRIHRDAAQDFVEDDEPDLDKCACVVKAAHEVHSTMSAIIETLYTQPVMVHVAGPKRQETNPDDEDEEGIIQRCQRCGSVLNFWDDNMAVLDPETGPRRMEEDDIPWWDEGAIVAKATANLVFGTYEIAERPLAKHERECADLSGLGE